MLPEELWGREDKKICGEEMDRARTWLRWISSPCLQVPIQRNRQYSLRRAKLNWSWSLLSLLLRSQNTILSSLGFLTSPLLEPSSPFQLCSGCCYLILMLLYTLRFRNLFSDLKDGLKSEPTGLVLGLNRL